MRIKYTIYHKIKCHGDGMHEKEKKNRKKSFSENKKEARFYCTRWKPLKNMVNPSQT